MNNKIKKNLKSFTNRSGTIEDCFFIGRDEELRLLDLSIRELTHSAVRADRQYGKTVLISKAIEKTSIPNVAITIDLKKITSVNKIRNMILTQAKSKTEMLFRNSWNNLKSLGQKVLNKLKNDVNEIKLSIGKNSLNLKFSPENDKEGATIEEIDDFVETLSILDELCCENQKTFILYIDEVQELIKCAGENYQYLAEKLAAYIPTLKRTVIFISGSEISIIDKMLITGNKEYLMHFQKIPLVGLRKTPVCHHLRLACEERRIFIHQKEIDLLYAITNGVASEVTYFGGKITKQASRNSIVKVTSKTIIDLLYQYLDDKDTVYKEKYEKLSAIKEGEKVLLLIHEQKYQRYNFEGLEKHKMEYLDNIISELLKHTFIVTLENKDYMIADPIFIFYMKFNTTVKRNRFINKITSSPNNLIENGILLLN